MLHRVLSATYGHGPCFLVPISLPVLFAILHIFLSHRLVEVPQLVEMSFERYAGVAKLCLPRSGTRNMVLHRMPL